MPNSDKELRPGERRTHLQRFGNALPAIALVSCVALIALIIPLAEMSDRGYGFFTRDPTQIGQIPYYSGYLSSLGVLTWATGAAVALFSAMLLDVLAADRSEATFLFYFGCLTALLTLDDLFLMHENFFLNEKIVFLAYILIALTGCVLFKKHLLRQATGFAITAACAFVVSLTIDRFQYSIQERIGDFRILFEDGSKFFGAVCWAIFLCKASAASLLQSARS